MSDRDPDPTQVEQTAIHAPVGGAEPPYEPPVAYDEPGGEPPDRRPWIIVGILAIVALVLLLLLLLRDDDDDDADSSGFTTTTEETTSSSSSSTTEGTTTTTEDEGTTSSSSPGVTVPPEDCADAGEGPATPGLAAGTVFDAWVRGDEAYAAELMTPAALEELFDRDGTGATDEFLGCMEEDIPDPHVDCTFLYEGGATHYLMNFSDTDGWKVFDIEQVAD